MAGGRNLVERFYSDIWNRCDFAMAAEILADDFRFRGSLGPETVGVPAFHAYVESVHAALGDYHCTIEEMINAETGVAARMTFAGVHRGPLFGVAPTGRTVSWAGAAFFQIGRTHRFAMGAGGCGRAQTPTGRSRRRVASDLF
jgi:steroid delta-isomerase-like uncharacterized protein